MIRKYFIFSKTRLNAIFQTYTKLPICDTSLRFSDTKQWQLLWILKSLLKCVTFWQYYTWLAHWGRVTHICVGNLTIIGPDNGLSPGRRQAIIWTNAGILVIEPQGTNFREILIGIHTLSFKKIHLKMSSAKWRPFCLGLNVLTHLRLVPHVCIGESGKHWFR